MQIKNRHIFSNFSEPYWSAWAYSPATLGSNLEIINTRPRPYFLVDDNDRPTKSLEVKYSSIAVIGTTEDVPVLSFCHELEQAMLVSGPVARLSSQVLRAKLGPQALDQPQDYQVNSWLGQQEDRNICVIYQVRQATLKHSQTPPCDSVTRVWAQRGAGCCSYPQQFLLLLTAIFLYNFLLLPTANFTSIHSKCYS